MTVIEKLSDRHNLVFDLIKLILVNEGPMDAKKLQYKLFQSGVYIKGSLMKQAISVMNEKGELNKPHAELVQEKSEA